MQLVPIPTSAENIHKSFPLWFPFLQDIARDSGEPLESLVDRVVRYEIQVILIWDEVANRAAAIVGLRFCQRGADMIGETVWATGHDMAQWKHLLPDLERYLKEHCKCTVSRPICRPGWSRQLKQSGYITTHYMMEKRL